jgi:hypothetical protein
MAGKISLAFMALAAGLCVAAVLLPGGTQAAQPVPDSEAALYYGGQSPEKCADLQLATCDCGTKPTMWKAAFTPQADKASTLTYKFCGGAGCTSLADNLKGCNH